MKARYVLVAFVLALAAVHALVASWTPIQGDDWNHWMWAGRHREDSGWLAAFVSSHYTFADLASYLVARSRAFHVLVTPAVIAALVLGLFTLARRRTPNFTADDVLGIALASALIWITQPNAGSTLFHASSLAVFVYGSALAVWFFAPFWCRWQVPMWLAPALVLGGYCVGTSSRAIATATLVGVICVMRRRRERWMWPALAGLIVGVAVGYVKPPWLEVTRVVKRGLEQNLAGPGLLKFIVEEGGEVVSLVLAFVLVNHVLSALGRKAADEGARPDASMTLKWFAAWFVTAIWCLFGPRYNEATLFPATCILIICALPYFAWLAMSRPLRMAMIAFVVIVHATVWSIALSTYHGLGKEGAQRLATLAGTQPGGTAVIHPYSRIPPDFWFLGEDLGIARQRQLVALDGFGIRDVVFDKDFRRLDENPQLTIALETDGVSDAQLRAANVPPMWATEITAARKQFELFTKRLRAVTKADARLAIKNLAGYSDPRPLYAAWADSDGVMIPRTQRSSIDPNAQVSVRIYQPHAKRFSEAYVVQDGRMERLQYRGGTPVFRPMRSDLYVVIACNPQRCLAIDAFVARF